MKLNPIMVIISISYLAILIFAGVKLHGNIKTGLDEKIRNYCDSLQNPVLFQIMGKITRLANIETIFIISFPLMLYLLRHRDYVELTAIAISAGSAVILTQLIKLMFRRSRPAKKRRFNAFGYSFPSGHSTVGTAFYVIVVYVFSYGYRFFYLAMIGVIILSLLIALSRIMLGVHWFSDVIAGVGLGLICAYWGIFFYNQGYYFKYVFSRAIFN